MRRTKAEAEETRQKILDAAEQKFFTDGVAKTSLEEIAREAGLTRGAIYWHFKNKVELFKALHESVRLPQEDFLDEEATAQHPDPLSLIEQQLNTCIARIATDEKRQRIFTILMSRCEYVGEMIEALIRQLETHDQMRDNLERSFRAAQKNGTLHPAWSPELAAQCLDDMLFGAVTDWLRYGQRFDLMARVTATTQALFRSFRIDPTVETRPLPLRAKAAVS